MPIEERALSAAGCAQGATSAPPGALRGVRPVPPAPSVPYTIHLQLGNAAPYIELFVPDEPPRHHERRPGLGQAPGFNAPIAFRLAKTKPAMPTTYTKPSLEQNNKADRD